MKTKNTYTCKLKHKIKKGEKKMKITKLRKAKGLAQGFTLVELVITIAIVIVLSVVSVPIYRNYVDKAKMSEGYALLGTILSAQKAYYSEHGNFYGPVGWVSYDSFFGVDARGNKYFSYFGFGNRGNKGCYVNIFVRKPIELQETSNTEIILQYNITLGGKFNNYPKPGYDTSWES